VGDVCFSERSRKVIRGGLCCGGGPMGLSYRIMDFKCKIVEVLE
jgi:hypothetical protein